VSSEGRTTYRHAAKLALQPLRPAAPAVLRWRQHVARELFLVRLKTLAMAMGATVEVDLADTVEFDRQPRLEIYAQTYNRLRVGPGTRFGDGVRLSLRGGSFEIGSDCQIRRLGTYQITGTARIGSGVAMSTGLVFHCAESVELGDLSMVGEYSTITDSWHLRTPPGVPVHHASQSKPVVIGRNVWVGAHAVITAGITVGDQAFVGAGAVVTKDVPAGWLVGGVPARPLRELSVEG
jgi:acetyltransferase-like isoleucine patch superfamily enzyme